MECGCCENEFDAENESYKCDWCGKVVCCECFREIAATALCYDCYDAEYGE